MASRIREGKFTSHSSDFVEGVYFSVTRGMSDVANATSAIQTFRVQAVSDISGAVAAIDGFYADALDPETGEFLLELVGVVDDPFAA